MSDSIAECGMRNADLKRLWEVIGCTFASLVAQCLERVDLRCPACGQPQSNQRYQHEQRRDRSKGHWIIRLHTIKLIRDLALPGTIREILAGQQAFQGVTTECANP